MSDINPQSPPPITEAPRAEPRDGAQEKRCRRRGGRKPVVILALIGSFLAGGFLFSHVHAISDDRMEPGWMQRANDAGARDHGGYYPEGRGPQGHRPDGPPPPMTPAERLAHARDTIDHALTGVDASTDQKTRVLAIFDTTAATLKDAPSILFTTRLQAATLLTASTVDREKLEALRTARVNDIDADSKIVVKAIADAADVLTPDQRIRLAMVLEHMHPAPPPR